MSDGSDSALEGPALRVTQVLSMRDIPLMRRSQKATPHEPLVSANQTLSDASLGLLEGQRKVEKVGALQGRLSAFRRANLVCCYGGAHLGPWMPNANIHPITSLPFSSCLN